MLHRFAHRKCWLSTKQTSERSDRGVSAHMEAFAFSRAQLLRSFVN